MKHLDICTVEFVPWNGTAISWNKGRTEAFIHPWLLSLPLMIDHSLGCMIQLGVQNLFRYNNPVEAARLQSEGGDMRKSVMLGMKFSVAWILQLSNQHLVSVHSRRMILPFLNSFFCDSSTLYALLLALVRVDHWQKYSSPWWWFAYAWESLLASSCLGHQIYFYVDLEVWMSCAMKQAPVIHYKLDEPFMYRHLQLD